MSCGLHCEAVGPLWVLLEPQDGPEPRNVVSSELYDVSIIYRPEERKSKFHVGQFD